MMKHTLGPWYVDEEDTFGVGCRAIMSEDTGEPVAHVETWVDSSVEEDEQARANAELIAAAPRLLNALKEIREVCDQVNLPNIKVGIISRLAQRALEGKP